MHPFLNSRLRVTLFLVSWAGVAVLLAGFLSRLDGRPFTHALAFAGPLSIAFGFVSLSAWWVCRSHPASPTQAHVLVSRLGGAALQATAVWVGMGALWAGILYRLFGIGPDRAGIFRDLTVLAVAGIVLYGESIVFHYFTLAFERSRDAERRALESQVAAREAELRALRAQLDPHFLFNSLNSINALIGRDAESARRMCESLGDFLRRTLALGAREAVALEEELSLVDRYLAIERVRFGERLEVERAIDPAAQACLVPPLLLQPLVENAVKHGVADRVEGGTVRIAAARRGATLVLEVENGCDPDAPPRRGSGLGLDNVRRRIDAFGAQQARLDVDRTPDRFRVTLSLPATAPEPGAVRAASVTPAGVRAR